MRPFLCAVALLCALASAAHAAPPVGIYGLYKGQPLSVAAAGVTCITTWAAVQPTAAAYDWTSMDACITAATGRPVQIGIEGGVYAPAWLYAAGAQAMTETWAWEFSFPMCSAQKFPLPWDATFLKQWNVLTAAMGARYATNPQLAAVKVTPLMSKDPEDVYQIVAPAACPGSPDPLATWQAAGYRPALMTAAFGQALAAYVLAFPATPLVFQTGPWAMPGIDATGALTKAPDWALTTALDTQFVAAVGARAILQNNGLAVGWTWTPPIAGVAIATQAGAPITGDAACRDNGGHAPCNPVTVLRQMLAKAHASGDVFAEFYAPDINNTAMAGVFAEANKPTTK